MTDRPTSVYRFFDKTGALLYVGITHNPGSRWSGHTSRAWWQDVANTSIEPYPDRASAQAAEKRAILDEQPRYNLQGIDPEAASPRVRQTVDLTQARHVALAQWRMQTTVELGRTRLSTQDVLSALVGVLVTDETVARKVRAYLDVPRGPEDANIPEPTSPLHQV